MHLGRALLVGVLALHAASRVSVAADTAHEVSALNFAQGATETVSLRSTDRLPEASGTVKVERKGGTTELGVQLDAMKPASLFGGDYNTYVLWVVPPGGRPENAGEILLDGTRAKLRVSTSASVFAILVTAEPHFLVSTPSAFVMLETRQGAGQTFRPPLVEGLYNFQRASLENVKQAKGKVHTEVRQALTAIRLAHRAGADTLAREAIEEAQRALEKTLSLWRERNDRSEIDWQARQTVRLAVAAQQLAQDRALGPEAKAEGWGGK